MAFFGCRLVCHFISMMTMVGFLQSRQVSQVYVHTLAKGEGPAAPHSLGETQIQVSFSGPE